jgi:hypothetical protein
MFAKLARPFLLLSLVVIPLAQSSNAEEAVAWKAGLAKVAITPQDSMWMAGYAARKKPSEGKVQDLFAKALAIEDGAGTRLVIVTTDLIGIPRDLRDWLEAQVQEKYGLPPAGLLLNASHTHCGPELRTARVLSAGLPPERFEQSQKYYNHLREQLRQLIGDALDDLAPAKLSYTHGRAGFAMNRRLPTAKGFNNAPYPDGPVDHEVPVLKITGEKDELRAVLFGYACHNTTLSFFQFCGDYAGYAQQYLEESHPGVTALFLTGCGGDQNPQPRGSLEQAQQHGRALANGVEAALLGPPKPIEGPLRLAMDSVAIEFADPPSREELTRLSQSSDTYDQRRGTALLKELEEKGEIHKTYPYLIHGVRWGDDLLLVALAGEVVVDYSLRLKHELGGQSPVWIAGYSNDVFGYVPSLRVLQEGGYEAGGAMRYSSHPGPFSPTIEKLIVAGVQGVVDKLKSASGQ